MPEPVARRDSAAARRTDGQPLKSKAEKRAEAKAAKARARTMRKRRRALTVGAAAVLTLAVLIGLIAWIGSAVPPTDPPAASTGAEAQAGPSPTEPSAAFPPLPAGADPALREKPAVTAGTTPVTELTTTTLVQGTGATVQAGQTIDVNYVGVTYADGAEFDSSWSRSQPFSFQIGAGKVIPGWDQGLIGAKVGSRVQLDIPADLAYGDNPGGGQPAGVLRFVVDVLAAG